MEAGAILRAELAAVGCGRADGFRANSELSRLKRAPGGREIYDRQIGLAEHEHIHGPLPPCGADGRDRPQRLIDVVGGAQASPARGRRRLSEPHARCAR